VVLAGESVTAPMTVGAPPLVAFMGESSSVAASFEGDTSSSLDGVNMSCGWPKLTAANDLPAQLAV
jgi:hypothetical protein